MKKIINILAAFSLLFIVASSSCSAGSLLDPSAAGTIQNNANDMRGASGLGQVSLGTIIATIIQAGLGLLATIFIVLMVIAGFQWMTASGNEEKVKKATGMIKTAVIGLVIVLAAYAITYFIFNFLPFSGGSISSGSANGGLTTN